MTERTAVPHSISRVPKFICDDAPNFADAQIIVNKFIGERFFIICDAGGGAERGLFGGDAGVVENLRA